ncbi:hypothetical protein ACLOJK_009879 [Asimina triloba]
MNIAGQPGDLHHRLRQHLTLEKTPDSSTFIHRPHSPRAARRTPTKNSLPLFLIKTTESPATNLLHPMAVPCTSQTVIVCTSGSASFHPAEATHRESAAIVCIARRKDLHKKLTEEPPLLSEEESVEMEGKPRLGLEPDPRADLIRAVISDFQMWGSTVDGGGSDAIGRRGVSKESIRQHGKKDGDRDCRSGEVEEDEDRERECRSACKKEKTMR